jgi:hypothetical protein
MTIYVPKISASENTAKAAGSRFQESPYLCEVYDTEKFQRSLDMKTQGKIKLQRSMLVRAPDKTRLQKCLYLRLRIM